MYARAFMQIFERLIFKDEEKGESFRTKTENEMNEILFNEIHEWANILKYDGVCEEISELCDIVVASVIKIEWLLQGGQIVKNSWSWRGGIR